MATRFYGTDTNASVGPTLNAKSYFNEASSSPSRKKMFTTNQASSSSGGLIATFASGDIDYAICRIQLISEPLEAATLYSTNNVLFVTSGYEGDAGHDAYLKACVFVCSNTGSTIRSNYWGGIASSEYKVGSGVNNCTRTITLTNTGGDITIESGDRIVLEIGVRGTYVASSSIGPTNYCSTNANDLTFADSDTHSSYRPWVEFVEDLTFITGTSLNNALLLQGCGK